MKKMIDFFSMIPYQILIFMDYLEQFLKIYINIGFIMILKKKKNQTRFVKYLRVLLIIKSIVTKLYYFLREKCLVKFLKMRN